MGEVQQPPEIMIIGKIVAVWGNIIRRKLGRNFNIDYIKISATGCSITITLLKTLTESINYNSEPQK